MEGLFFVGQGRAACFSQGGAGWGEHPWLAREHLEYNSVQIWNGARPRIKAMRGYIDRLIRLYSLGLLAIYAWSNEVMLGLSSSAKFPRIAIMPDINGYQGVCGQSICFILTAICSNNLEQWTFNMPEPGRVWEFYPKRNMFFLLFAKREIWKAVDGVEEFNEKLTNFCKKNSRGAKISGAMQMSTIQSNSVVHQFEGREWKSVDTVSKGVRDDILHGLIVYPWAETDG